MYNFKQMKIHAKKIENLLQNKLIGEHCWKSIIQFEFKEKKHALFKLCLRIL